MTRTKAKPGPPLRPASDATATHEDRMTAKDIQALQDFLSACEADFGRVDELTEDDGDDEPVALGQNADGSPDGSAVTFGHMRRAAAAIRALAAQVQPAPVAVAVKPLVWVQSEYWKIERSREYVVQCEYDKNGVKAWAFCKGGDHVSDHPTVEAAKAAAQADYAARILSAIPTARPVAEVQAEAVAGIAEVVRGWRNTCPMTGDECANAILALTPADTQAALDRRDAATREAVDAQIAALSAALRALADTSKAEIARLTMHLQRIAELHPETIDKGPRAYAKAALIGGAA